MTLEEMKEKFEKFDCELVSTEYIGYKEKYKFICNKHKEEGVQETYLRNLSRGSCCHYCAKERQKNSRAVPDDELRIITEKAGFIFVRSEVINGNRHIFYKCKKHLEKGEQHMLAYNMRKSKGLCPYCLNRCRTTDSFKEEIKKIHPNIEVIGEYVSTNKNIKCRCLLDGYEWNADPKNLLNGAGCKKCASKNNGISCRHTQEWFDEKMKEIHPNIEVLTPYITSKNKVKCRCLLDGYTWEATPDSLINSKTGCMKCSNNKTSERCKKTNEDFLKQLMEVNPNIIPLENYVTDHTKIKCICKIHDYAWSVAPNKILHKFTGCPKCSASSGENIINFILDKWGYSYEIEKKFQDCIDKKPLPFDKYLKDFNILIEFDGEQHYKPITFGRLSDEDALAKFEITKKHDNIKNEYCKKNNIPLIRIPYWEKDNLESYLFDELVKYNAIKLVS